MEKLRYTDSLPQYMQGLVNIRHANATQYQWLYEHGCPHRHRYSTHFSCFLSKFNIQEKKAGLDIEAGGLDSDFDIMLSWAIKTINKDEYFYDHVTKDDLDSGISDARILSTLIETLKGYDRIVTHYGNAGRFDVPFIRGRYLWLKARKVYEGPDFPIYGEMYQSDTYTFAKRCLKIHSRRQNSIAKAILGVDIKTKIDNDYWLAIKYGTKQQRNDAIKYIVDHNLRDTEQLEGNYLALLPYVREVRSSI